MRWLIIVLILISGCSRSPNLPPTERQEIVPGTIVRHKLTGEKGIAAYYGGLGGLWVKFESRPHDPVFCDGRELEPFR